MTLDVSRRSLLTLGAGLGSAAMLGGSALAKAPKVGTQAPPFYRFNVGNAEVTVVSDGALALGDPKGTFTGVPDEEMRKMLSDNFLSPTKVVLEQNSPIVNMGDKLVLFDTGLGTAKGFGPTTGRQQKSMKEAGIKPEDIDAVVFSHAHIDHIGGVVDDNNKVLFPNAQYYIAQNDLEFWTDEGKMGSPVKDFIVHARKNLLPVRDRIVFYKDGQEFLPGVQAILAPGHTVGHTIFMISSGGKSLAYIADLTHHPILLMEKPRMEFSYDTDPKQAAASRVKMLDMLAANKIAVMTYHYPWPGIGHVAKTGEGFHYVPEPMTMTLLSAIPKIQATQDDAGRSAFKFPCKKLASGTLFDLIAQPQELRFPLVGFGPLRLFQIVHGRCTDGTGYFPLTVNHRKPDHHPLEFVTAKAAACQRHLPASLKNVSAFKRRLDRRRHTPPSFDRYAAAAAFAAFAGGGLISAILRRQSASESWGPETNVPLTLVEYHPDTTPSRSDSSVLTWRGERFCMDFLAFMLALDLASSAESFLTFEKQQLALALVGEPGAACHSRGALASMR